MTLSEILAECYRRLAYPATPAASDTTRLTSFVNTTHRQILGLPGMESLRDDTITFASVAGQATYGLPPALTRIEQITDRTTHISLALRSLQDVRQSDPGVSQTGTPDSYIVRGYQAVAAQPAVASTIYAKSTSGADTAPNVYLEGIGSTGALITATNQLSGITAVPLTGVSEITKLWLRPAAVGTVTIHAVSGTGAELARFAVGETYARYLGIQLYPTPSSVITYHVDYVRIVVDLSDTNDEPLLPDDFHWLLVEGALLKEWTKRDDDRRVAAEREYAKGISALKYFINAQWDDIPVSGRRHDWRERSRFGAWFPATRY